MDEKMSHTRLSDSGERHETRLDYGPHKGVVYVGVYEIASSGLPRECWEQALAFCSQIPQALNERVPSRIQTS